MIRFLLITLLISFSMPLLAEDNPLQEKEKSWWQKRHDRKDIYYPHKPHMYIMEQNGDSCMLCHPFSNNITHDEKTLKSLNQINNEPLEAICHDCHVEKINAPSECQLCHPNPSTIWPENHNYDYNSAHADDARQDQTSCNKCHKQLSFCTDCHFKRKSSGLNVHMLGYKTLHGLDARIAPAECGSCHQTNFCSDCHRRVR